MTAAAALFAALGAALLAAEPAPTPTPTPIPLPTATPDRRDPHLVAALESRQGIGMERVALFDDGTLVRVRVYRGERTIDRKDVSREEIDVVRRVCLEALAVRAKDVEDPGRSVLGDAGARRVTLEVTDPAGGSRVYAYDDLVSLPLPVGRARGAMEDLRGRFEKQDLGETKWDAVLVKKGTYLKRRSDGAWYRVVHDDALDHDFELEELERDGEQGSNKLRIFVYRGDLPRLFEDPAVAGARPPAPPSQRRR
jgi:hypothetical protein